MKKNLKIILFLLLSVSFGLTQFYCTKRSNQSKPVALDQAESFAKSIDPQEEYTSADVLIKTNSEGDIIVLVNTKDSSNEKLYILQGTKERSINKSFKNGQVLYLYHSLIVNSLDDKERYYFGVSKPEEKAIFEKLPLSYKSFFSASIYGYGLVQIRGFLPNKIEVFKDNANPFDDLNLYRSITNNIIEDANPDCDAGGAGATSCSRASGGYSCSVSCSSAYYACCNDHALSPPSCNCKPIK